VTVILNQDTMETTLELRCVKSSRKAKGDGHLRRAEILRAAERIFVERGYEGATIRKIADAVGVSSTALYMHFRDKDQILLEICSGAMERLLAGSTEIAALPVDAVTRVRMMLEGYIRFALENPNAYQLVFMSRQPFADEDEKRHLAMDLGAQCRETFLEPIREIAAQGRLRTGDPRAAHQALWVAAHGLVALMITKPTFEWVPTGELTDVLIDGLLFGLIAE
jgi:AcrR family transcriptional regulator